MFDRLWLNFLHFIFNNLSEESSYTLFKLKYIVLYHLRSSILKLQNRFYKDDVFTDQSKEYMKTILEDNELKNLVSKSRFRNILIHYGLEGISPDSLSTEVEFYGLTERFFEKSYSEISTIVDRQIERISTVLEDWLNWRV